MGDFLEEARKWADLQRAEVTFAHVAPVDTMKASAPTAPAAPVSTNTITYQQHTHVDVGRIGGRDDTNLTLVGPETASASNGQIQLLHAQVYEQTSRAEAAEARCIALEQALERYSRQGVSLEVSRTCRRPI
jgi:4-alpha-glucanotransferase